MKEGCRIRPILVLTVTFALCNNLVSANELEDFVFSQETVPSKIAPHKTAPSTKEQTTTKPEVLAALTATNTPSVSNTSNTPLSSPSAAVQPALHTSDDLEAFSVPSNNDDDSSKIASSQQTNTKPAVSNKDKLIANASSSKKRKKRALQTRGESQTASKSTKDAETPSSFIYFSNSDQKTLSLRQPELIRTETPEAMGADSSPTTLHNTKISSNSEIEKIVSSADSQDSEDGYDYSRSLSTSLASTGTIASMWKTVQEVAIGALGLLGVRYKFGGNTPETGLDCSGFVRYVFNQALGIKLPRSSREISQVGSRVEWNGLIPGDLVFFNTRNSAFSHVGIYLGDNRFIHSPRTGKDVEIGRITDRYWSARFSGGRRILGQLAARSPRKSD
ncbi:MAG: C40 family peptidase [Pseudomonadota bacterium]